MNNTLIKSYQNKPWDWRCLSFISSNPTFFIYSLISLNTLLPIKAGYPPKPLCAENGEG